MKKVTDLYTLTMKVSDNFKDTYMSVFEKLSKELNMPKEVKPIQVILEGVVGFCQISVLREPSIPGYKMQDYIFQLNQEMKIAYKMNSVIIDKRSVLVDDEKIPTSMKLDLDAVKSIIKKAIEDDIFTEKYKETITRIRDIDPLDALEMKADSFEKGLSSIKITVETSNIEESKIEDESDTVEEIEEIKYSIERDGQLCLLMI